MAKTFSIERLSGDGLWSDDEHHDLRIGGSNLTTSIKLTDEELTELRRVLAEYDGGSECPSAAVYQCLRCSWRSASRERAVGHASATGHSVTE
jgi:hypothetical protein